MALADAGLVLSNPRWPRCDQTFAEVPYPPEEVELYSPGMLPWAGVRGGGKDKSQMDRRRWVGILGLGGDCGVRDDIPRLLSLWILEDIAGLVSRGASRQ